jgi:hypothetical protein
LLVTLNCLNGFFDAPNHESLSETALKAPTGGAAAFISSTTVSALAGQDAFARALAQRLGAGNVRVVGDVFFQAQQAIAGVAGAEEVLRTWVLIGDPASRLALRVAPVADAGPDRESPTGAPATFDGRGSRGPEGARLDFAWSILEQPASSVAVLENPDSPTPVLVPPLPGRYTLALVVSADGLESVPATVRIDVSDPAPDAGCAEDEGAGQAAGFALTLLLPLAANAARRRRR